MFIACFLNFGKPVTRDPESCRAVTPRAAASPAPWPGRAMLEEEPVKAAPQPSCFYTGLPGTSDSDMCLPPSSPRECVRRHSRSSQPQCSVKELHAAGVPGCSAFLGLRFRFVTMTNLAPRVGNYDIPPSLSSRHFCSQRKRMFCHSLDTWWNETSMCTFGTRGPQAAARRRASDGLSGEVDAPAPSASATLWRGFIV